MSAADFLNKLRQDQAQRQRIESTAEKLGLSTTSPTPDATSTSLAQMLLGVSNPEELDPSCLKDPKVRKALEVYTKVKAFIHAMMVDNGASEAILFLRGVLFDQRATTKDKIAAASALIGAGKHMGRASEEFVRLLKELDEDSDKKQVDPKSLSAGDITQMIVNLVRGKNG
jgi:hypothetical protein